MSLWSSHGSAMTSKAPDYQKVVAEASRRCNVVIDKDDVSEIKNCRAGSRLASWIEQNLTSDTLLSSEELRLTEELSQHGNSRGTRKDGDDRGVVPMREEELLEAIAELDASTEALNRQSQALEAQQTLVERRHYDSLQIRQSRGNYIAQMEQKNSGEIQKLDPEICQVQEEIEVLFRHTKDHIGKRSKSISSQASDLTNSHDRRLKDLTQQNLAGASIDQAASMPVEKVERLAAALSKLVAEEIQTRLDRTYLESLQAADSDEPNDTEDVRVLEEDLHSLYTEIPGVAEMFVSQAYTEPLTKAIREEEKRRKKLASAHTTKITAQLSSMTADLEQLTKQLDEFHSYRSVVKRLQGDYDQFHASSKLVISAKAKPQTLQEVGPAMDVLLRRFGLPTDPSIDLHESIGGKVARSHENGHGSLGIVSRDSKRAIEARRMVVESFARNVDHGEGQTASDLHALEAEVASLREQVERISAADNSKDLANQRMFIERWS